jgi:hypothetical protein
MKSSVLYFIADQSKQGGDVFSHLFGELFGFGIAAEYQTTDSAPENGSDLPCLFSLKNIQ